MTTTHYTSGLFQLKGSLIDSPSLVPSFPNPQNVTSALKGLSVITITEVCNGWAGIMKYPGIIGAVVLTTIILSFSQFRLIQCHLIWICGSKTRVRYRMGRGVIHIIVVALLTVLKL